MKSLQVRSCVLLSSPDSGPQAGAGASSRAAQKATLEAPRRTLLLRAGQRSQQRATSGAPGTVQLQAVTQTTLTPGPSRLPPWGPAHLPPPRTPVPRSPPLFKSPDCFLGGQTEGKGDRTPVLTHGGEGRPGDSDAMASSAPETVVTVITSPPPSVWRLAFLFSFRVAWLSLLLFH